MSGHRTGTKPRQKNGPALAGHRAEAVCDAITKTMQDLPDHLRKSLIWDQGVERAQHEKLKSDTRIDIDFYDPQSPWQRGSNKNTNGLLRQYFPKGTDLNQHRREEFGAVAYTLNSRPYKTLGWKTPAKAPNEILA